MKKKEVIRISEKTFKKESKRHQTKDERKAVEMLEKWHKNAKKRNFFIGDWK